MKKLLQIIGLLLIATATTNQPVKSATIAPYNIESANEKIKNYVELTRNDAYLTGLVVLENRLWEYITTTNPSVKAGLLSKNSDIILQCSDKALQFAMYFFPKCEELAFILMARVYLNIGIDPEKDIASFYEYTLIHTAAKNNFNQMLRMFASWGLNIDIDSNGITPLYEAVRYEKYQSVITLLRLGANPHHKNGAPKSPFSLMQELNNGTMKIIFNQLGAQCKLPA